MAKRVNLGIEGLRINETECQILDFVVERSRQDHTVGCAFVSISRKQLAQAVGRTALTTWRTCQHLVTQGLLEMRDEHLGSGAQVANSYRATAIGLEVVRLYRLHRDAARHRGSGEASAEQLANG